MEKHTQLQKSNSWSNTIIMESVTGVGGGVTVSLVILFILIET